MKSPKHLILLWLGDYDDGYVYVSPGDEWEYVGEVFPEWVDGIVVPNTPEDDVTPLQEDLKWTLIDTADCIHQASYL